MREEREAGEERGAADKGDGGSAGTLQQLVVDGEKEEGGKEKSSEGRGEKRSSPDSDNGHEDKRRRVFVYNLRTRKHVQRWTD